MRLVTKGLKCLGGWQQKVRRFAPHNNISFLLPVAFRPFRPHRNYEARYPSSSLSQLRIPQLLVEIPCPAKTTLREIGKMNLVMRRKCDMEAGE